MVKFFFSLSESEAEARRRMRTQALCIFLLHDISAQLFNVQKNSVNEYELFSYQFIAICKLEDTV